MSTLCPYRIIKGDDGLSVKVEWDAHYLTDEQIGMVREYVADIEAENAKLRELVRDLWSSCPLDASNCRKCKHGGINGINDCDLLDRMEKLGVSA